MQEQTHPFGGFPPGPTLVPVIDTTSTYSKATYLFNASYKFNRSSAALRHRFRRFRGGGLNPLSEPFDPIPGAFAPDSLWNYEAGAKGRLLDGRLTTSSISTRSVGRTSRSGKPRRTVLSTTSATQAMRE